MSTTPDPAMPVVSGRCDACRATGLAHCNDPINCGGMDYYVRQRDAQAALAALQAEMAEQCRLLGISGSREARLQARLDEAEKDAARYRWLTGDESEWEALDSGWLSRNDLYGTEPNDLDAFIDAHLRGQS